MPKPFPTPALDPVVVPWNQDLIFAALGDRVRRRLLFSLARSGPQIAAQVKNAGGKGLDSALKHLAKMHRAGLVVRHENPKDGRRLIYSLAPSVPLQRTPAGLVIDFGFCLLRLSEGWE